MQGSAFPIKGVQPITTTWRFRDHMYATHHIVIIPPSIIIIPSFDNSPVSIEPLQLSSILSLHNICWWYENE